MAKKLIMVFTALTVALLAANSSAASSDEAIQELYKAAKAEGKVVWQYGSSPKPLADAIAVFEKRFPGIKMEVFSYSTARTPTRVIAEAAANKLTLDVGMVRNYQILPLLERDLVVKDDWTKYGAKNEDIMLDGYLLYLYDSPYVWARNTDLVKEAEMPKTWDDVLDPKWKGHKISIRSSPPPLATMYLEWKKDKEKAINYMKRLQQQELVAESRGAVAFSRVATGECHIGRFPISFIITALKDNPPVQVLPISPTDGLPQGLFIPKGAPHPNAAKLLVSWIVSPEGREEFKKMGYGKSYPPEASLAAKMIADKGVKYILIDKKEDLVEFDSTFVKLVADILKFQPEAD